jgi:hypothetical protein
MSTQNRALRLIGVAVRAHILISVTVKGVYVYGVKAGQSYQFSHDGAGHVDAGPRIYLEAL